MKVKVAMAVALAAGCGLLGGCGGDAARKTPRKSKALKRDRNERFSIAMTCASFSAPPRRVSLPASDAEPHRPPTFLMSCKKHAEAVVEAHHDEFLFVNAEYKASNQVAAIDDFVERDAAFILLNPVDADAVAGAVRRANAAKIPVVTFGVNAAGGEIDCFVDANDRLAGRLCADYVGWRLKGRGNVAILDHPGVAAAAERVAGFREHLAEAFPGVAIVATKPGRGSREQGTAAAKKILDEQAALDAIFAIDDSSGLGASAAIERAGKGQVFVVAVHGTVQAVAEIRRGGPFAMTVAQFPREVGRKAAEMGYRVIEGKDVPAHVRVSVVPITAENAAGYLASGGRIPEQIEIPWPSKLRIAVASD